MTQKPLTLAQRCIWNKKFTTHLFKSFETEIHYMYFICKSKPRHQALGTSQQSGSSMLKTCRKGIAHSVEIASLRTCVFTDIEGIWINPKRYQWLALLFSERISGRKSKMCTHTRVYNIRLVQYKLRLCFSCNIFTITGL